MIIKPAPQRGDIGETRPVTDIGRRCFNTHTGVVDQLWPTLIAFGSLLVAGLTVVVSYLNAGRQAQAAAELEHAKWLREKRRHGVRTSSVNAWLLGLVETADARRRAEARG